MSPDLTYDPNENKPWWEIHFLDILKTSTVVLFSTVLISCGNVVGGVLSLINGIGGLFISGIDHIAGGSMLAMLGLQTIHLAFTSCNLAFGILTGILGLATLTFASSEIEEGITGDNYLKDNMPHWLYSTSMFVVVAATTLVNIVGPKFQCFKEGTLVKTKDGVKAIEEIKEGDLVYAYDEKTGKCAYKRVLSLSRNVTKKWCSVSLLVNGKKESIVSTPGHKYYLPFNNCVRDANEVLEHDSYIGLSNKWVSAKDLKCGDKVLLSDGSYGIIDSVIVNDLVEQEVTYNFEVEDFHTYFVGEYCVCVHNDGCWSTQKRRYWKNEANELKGDGITYRKDYGDNLERMMDGKAPIDIDGKYPVELHHIQGRGKDLIVQMTRTNHRLLGGFHSVYGFVGFPDITELADWAGRYV